MSELEIVSTGIRDKELTEHEKVVRDIRALADWVEKHPELGAPTTSGFDYWPEAKDMRKFAIAFGKADKTTLGDSYFMLRKTFGSVKIDATWHRDRVCERVVVGQEEVEEEVVVSQTKELRKVTREKVEWRCPKVLEPKELGDGA